jgi:hypothetical protein
MPVGDDLAGLLGEVVVLDGTAPFVHIGRLVAADHHYLKLEDADVHDLRDSATTRDLYVIDARRHGVNVNRRKVLVSREQIVSLSRLADVEA